MSYIFNTEFQQPYLLTKNMSLSASALQQLGTPTTARQHLHAQHDFNTCQKCRNPFPSLEKWPSCCCLGLSFLIMHHWWYMTVTIAQGLAGNDCPSPLIENYVSRTSRHIASFPTSSPGYHLNTNTWQHMGKGWPLCPGSSAVIIEGE